jgi:methyl-accepting chemotaxis protein
MSKGRLGKRIRLGIGMKISLIMVCMILILSFSINSVVSKQVSTAMNELFQERIGIDSLMGYELLNLEYPGAWSVEDGNLFKGTIKINDNNDFLDSLGDMTGGAVTIIQGDTRVATNVFDWGLRVVGTKVDPRVVDVVLTKGQTYIGEATIVEKPYKTMYKPLKNEKGEVIGMWFVGSSINTIDLKVNGMLRIVYILMGIVGLIAVLISILIVRRIVHPIKAINKQLHGIAEGEGDLTQELKVSSRDEVGDLAQAYNKMVGNLRNMIRQIGITAEKVAASSEELTASSEQTSKVAEENVSSLQNVATGSEKQLINVTEGAIAFAEMSKGIQQIATNAHTVSNSAGYAFDKSVEGSKLAEQMQLQMKAIQSTVEGLSFSVKGLGERTAAIDQIVEVITGIANQTNLLSLNAAIEAARAGEHGRGFAVVAGEVRKLAEQSANSANEIANLIAVIQTETAEVVKTMDETTSQVAEGATMALITSESFKVIHQSVNEVAEQIEETSAATQQLSAGSEQAASSMQAVKETMDATTRSLNQISEHTEGQLAMMEEISSSAHALSQMSEELHQLVGRFKV